MSNDIELSINAPELAGIAQPKPLLILRGPLFFADPVPERHG